MKKLISIIVASLVLITPVWTFAETASTTTDTQMQTMLLQIQTLQAQIKALHDAQAALQTAQNNVYQTLKLIRSLHQALHPLPQP